MVHRISDLLCTTATSLLERIKYQLVLDAPAEIHTLVNGILRRNIDHINTHYGVQKSSDREKVALSVPLSIKLSMRDT